MANTDPYVGPRPFERKDGDRFFGRDWESSELVSLLIAHPVVLLYAQSGAGKTSLLNANVFRLLEQSGVDSIGPVRVSGKIPAAMETASIGNVFLFHALVSGGVKPDEAMHLSLAEGLARCKGRENGSGSKPSVEDGSRSRIRVLVVDQFEEVFTTSRERWRQRDAFFEEVGASLDTDSSLRVLFAMREEYIAQLDSHAHLLPERLRVRFRLERLRSDSALMAVQEPLRGTRRSFGPGVAEKLVTSLLLVPVEMDDGMSLVTGEFIEPVQLQLVCERLWRKLAEDVTVIDESALGTLGGLDDALAEYYDDCMREVATAERIKEGVLRSWFEASLITADGVRALVYQERKVTAGLPNRIVERLEDLYLVREEVRSGSSDTWYELAHDRFIAPIRQSNRRWRRARIQGAAARLDLDQRADEWIAQGKPARLLLSSSETIETNLWLTSPEAEEVGVSPAVREFVQASQAAAEHRTNERLRNGVTALVVLLLLAVSFAVATFLAHRDLERATANERGALARALAAEPGREFDALALGIQAVFPKAGRDPDSESVAGLRRALAVIGDARWLHLPRLVAGASSRLSEDGSRTLGVGEEEIRVWNTYDGRTVFSTPARGGLWERAELIQNGGSVACVLNKGDVAGKHNLSFTSWNLSRPAAVLLPVTTGEAPYSFSEDRTHIAAISGSTVEIVDASTGRELCRLPLENGKGVTALEMAKDGGSIVVAEAGGDTVLWNVKPCRAIARLAHRETLAAFAFSSDGASVAGLSGGRLRVWRVMDGREEGPVQHEFAMTQGMLALPPNSGFRFLVVSLMSGTEQLVACDAQGRCQSMVVPSEMHGDARFRPIGSGRMLWYQRVPQPDRIQAMITEVSSRAELRTIGRVERRLPPNATDDLDAGLSADLTTLVAKPREDTLLVWRLDSKAQPSDPEHMSVERLLAAACKAVRDQPEAKLVPMCGEFWGARR